MIGIFSDEGRKRQAKRMAEKAEKFKQDGLMLSQTLYVRHQKLENYLIQIILFG